MSRLIAIVILLLIFVAFPAMAAYKALGDAIATTVAHRSFSPTSSL